MILVDTSVWVDHLRHGDSRLAERLEAAEVLMHPLFVGEIACGSLAVRATMIELLRALPGAAVAAVDEALVFVEQHRLWGKGIGYVDVHLLASTALSHGARLWTRDRRLNAAALALGLAHAEGAPH